MELNFTDLESKAEGPLKLVCSILVFKSYIQFGRCAGNLYPWQILDSLLTIA